MEGKRTEFSTTIERFAESANRGNSPEVLGGFSLLVHVQKSFYLFIHGVLIESHETTTDAKPVLAGPFTGLSCRRFGERKSERK